MRLLPTKFYLDLADANPVTRAQRLRSLRCNGHTIELRAIERTKVLEEVFAVLFDDECVTARGNATIVVGQIYLGEEAIGGVTATDARRESIEAHAIRAAWGRHDEQHGLFVFAR
jgi:hypothetical protein